MSNGGRKPTRLLTGATDGIGRELARLWAAREGRTFLHGRRPARAVGIPKTSYLRADLADPEAPETIRRALLARDVTALDLLCLNAAGGWFGPIEAQPETSIRELIEVDLLATMHLTRALLPLLREARGRVVFVSSVASALPIPSFAVYSAAKAAAEGFFRSLRVELAGEVSVQVLRPGAVQTAIHAKSGADPDAIGWSRFPAPEVVARAIDRAVHGSPRWRTLGFANGLARAVGRLVPGALERLQGHEVSR